MLDEIQQIESKAVAEIQAAEDEKILEELRIRHLGRKSPPVSYTHLTLPTTPYV